VSIVLIGAPFAVRLGGLKLQLDCAGRPEQAKVMLGLEPGGGAKVTVRLVWTLFPRITVRLDWPGVIPMSTTVRATGEEEELAEFASPA
jgi:hypothetical protein